MRIALNLGGEAVGRPMAPADVAADAERAEARGFPAAWTVHMSRGIDALTALGVAATRTSRIDLGVGVVPTYPRHPLALAQQAATVQALAAGRLTLGVGVSHRPVIEGLHGLSYDSPAEHMRDYLAVLVPLLTHGSVEHRGRFYAVDGGFTVPGTSPVSVVVGALGPRMTDVAGEFADGVVTWLAGPRSLESTAARLAAARAGRGPARVVAGVPVAVCDDVADGRAGAERVFARYGGLENYQRLFEREGVDSAADLAVSGPEPVVRGRLQAYADAGVTELWAVPYDADGTGVARTIDLLADVAT